MSVLAAKRRKIPGRRTGMHPLAVAAAVIAVAAFVTYYAFNGGLPFVHRFTLYAITNNSVNVRVTDPVRIAGIDVGSVEGTSPDGRFTKIKFYVNSNGLPIHRDATVTIRDRLFLEGGYYLAIDPGSPGAPQLKDGATIPSSQTASPVQFFKVLSLLDQSTRAALANTVDTFNQGFSPGAGQSLADSGAGYLKQAIPELTPVLKDTAWITQALRGTEPGDVGRLLGSSSQVSGTLAAGTAQLTDLVESLNTTAGSLAAADGSLAQSVQGVDAVLKAAPPALVAIDRALPPVAKLSVALDPGLRIAPPIVDSVIDAVRELSVVVAPVERTRLVTALKATFEQLPGLITELGKAFPVTDAVSKCLLTHVLPILNEEVPDGALSSGRPVWQDFIHFLPGVASAAQNFDGNGYWIRLLLGGSQNSVALGNLPGIGQVAGDRPSSSPILGSRPIWQGDLSPDAFQPEVPCTQDKLPSLVSATAPPDATDVNSSSTPLRESAAQLSAQLTSAAAKVGAR
jgi:phospholipid/cholesterol/gamma-HCH transport system substrate-binding protein